MGETNTHLFKTIVHKITAPPHRAELIGLILKHFVHHDTLSEEDFNQLKQTRILSFLRQVHKPTTFQKIRKRIKSVHNPEEKESLTNHILKDFEYYKVSHKMLKENMVERKKQIADCLRTTQFDSGNRGAIWNLRMSTSGHHSWMPSTQCVLGDIITPCKHPITHRDVAFINPKWKKIILTAWKCIHENNTGSSTTLDCKVNVGNKRKRVDVC